MKIKNNLFSQRKLKILFLISFSLIVINYFCCQKKSKNNFKDFKMLSSYDAEFKINPGFLICNKTSADLLIALVISSADNFETRENIRSKWFNLIEYPKIRRIFLVGLSQSQSINEKIEAESNQFNDIVQGMFIDSYYNLTLKTLTGFRWASIYCSNSIFTLKVDDDVLVNSKKLISYLEEFQSNHSRKTPTNTMMGFMWKNSTVQRDFNDRYDISKQEYNEDVYPPFMSGTAYLFTSDLNKKFYKTRLLVKMLKFEDVYVGVLASKLNTTMINIRDMIFSGVEETLDFENFIPYKSFLFFFLNNKL